MPVVLKALTLAGSGLPQHTGGRATALVVITIDTVRADRLSMYGGHHASTPALDQLAREGVVFDRAISVAPLTLPAHCRRFTGLLPPAHGGRDNADRPLGEHNDTLAEALQRRGFQTAAFVGSVVLRADRGLAHGFDVYSDGATGARVRRSAPQWPAHEVVDEAIDWLAGRGSHPFFLWVHLYDAHATHAPPAPFREAYAGDPYAGEIAFIDSQITRLLQDCIGVS